MDLSLSQLRTFYWIARLGGFRRAAEHIHTSQPAVSARIAALEERLGVPLFDRQRGGAQLTAQGRQLLTYVEQISQILDAISENVAERSAIEATLRLGVSETIVHAWLPGYVAALSQRFPRVDIDLTVDVSVNLRAGLIERTLDLALLMGPVSDYSVSNLDLPEFEMCFFAAAGLPEEGGLDSLFRRLPVITFARNTRPFAELSHALLTRYGPEARLFASASLSACIQMVRDGIGIGALPAAVVAEEERAGRLARIDPGWQANPLRFTASYVSNPASFVARAAAGVAQETAEEWERTRRAM
jgi:DNA-binding transcriptional LysR family regulator